MKGAGEQRRRRLLRISARTAHHPLCAGENLNSEIIAFRAARSPVARRTRSRTVITTYGREFAVAATLYERPSRPADRPADANLGKFPDGWHVVAAHVSLIDKPK
jgi:hypothetical protein